MITERLRRLVVGGLLAPGRDLLAHCLWHTATPLTASALTVRRCVNNSCLLRHGRTAQPVHRLCLYFHEHAEQQHKQSRKWYCSSVWYSTRFTCRIRCERLFLISFHPSRTSTAPLGQTLICESGGQEVCCGIANPFESSHGYINRSICLATQMQRGVTNSAICL